MCFLFSSLIKHNLYLLPLELRVYNIKYMLHVFCKQQYEKTPGYKHFLDIQLNTVEILLVWPFSETTASNSMYINMVHTIDSGVNSSTVFYICYLNYVINCNGIPT